MSDDLDPVWTVVAALAVVSAVGGIGLVCWLTFRLAQKAWNRSGRWE